MSTFRDITYMVLDQIKALNGDSTFTEDHVIYLANVYRVFLIKQREKQEKSTEISPSEEQTICLNLEETQAIPGLDYCNETYLRSLEAIPSLLEEGTASVYPVNYFAQNIAYVSKERFRFVGYNKYMNNIIYCTKGVDHHLYFKSSNPQFLYMEQAKMTGVFEDASEAAKLECNGDGEDSSCDIMDKNFPLDGELIPQLIQLIVKDLLGAAYRPNDDTNNDKDDVADLATYIAKNAKSNLAKQMQ